ncbi:hypothetical protein EJ02DRAFT_505854 [Clathrospora elynae]|uniref:Uncharacterized protein n=1 Tax=Clathrospora elynae TaxID=706981 RepID=A0A6A5SDH7_9PLEO|nr:hypothetical protein EJ02DRAFT_505854 [Clathrospora elynae]
MRIAHILGLFALVAAAAGPSSPPPARPPAALPDPPTRPASEDLWGKCRTKGFTFSWAMLAPDGDYDLRKWFWWTFPRSKTDKKFLDLYSTWGIDWALVDLCISPYSDEFETGKCLFFNIDHNDPKKDNVDGQKYKVDGKEYRATGAAFSFPVNWEEGVIMGFNRKSPKHAAEERTPKAPVNLMPGLNQFSDVTWIIWNLRYFLSVEINNEETKAVILRAMNVKGWQLSPWPGHMFESQWPETRAVIATPNVQGFAYLLVQHKEQLGNMYISKLHIFHGETDHKNPCIVIHISQPKSQAAEMERRDEGKSMVRVHMLRAKL